MTKLSTLKSLLLSASLLIASTHASAAIIKINFGGNTETTWNNLGQTGTPSIVDLLDENGDATGISLASGGTDMKSSNWSNNLGVGSAGIPGYTDNVTDSYIYVGPEETADGVITLSGLNTGTLYEITVYGGRGTTGSRTVDYTLTGASSQTLTRDVVNNTSLDTFSTLLPTAGGEVSLSFKANATSPSDYAYLNAMTINAIPEPSTLALVVGAFAALGLSRLRRK